MLNLIIGASIFIFASMSSITISYQVNCNSSYIKKSFEHITKSTLSKKFEYQTFIVCNNPIYLSKKGKKYKTINLIKTKNFAIKLD